MQEWRPISPAAPKGNQCKPPSLACRWKVARGACAKSRLPSYDNVQARRLGRSRPPEMQNVPPREGAARCLGTPALGAVAAARARDPEPVAVGAVGKVFRGKHHAGCHEGGSSKQGLLLSERQAPRQTRDDLLKVLLPPTEPPLSGPRWGSSALPRRSPTSSSCLSSSESPATGSHGTPGRRRHCGRCSRG